MPRSTTGLKKTAGPGRPTGSKDRVSPKFKDWCRRVIESPGYRKALEERLIKGKATAGVETAVLYYGAGKPPDHLQRRSQPRLSRYRSTSRHQRLSRS